MRGEAHCAAKPHRRPINVRTMRDQEFDNIDGAAGNGIVQSALLGLVRDIDVHAELKQQCDHIRAALARCNQHGSRIVQTFRMLLRQPAGGIAIEQLRQKLGAWLTRLVILLAAREHQGAQRNRNGLTAHSCSARLVLLSGAWTTALPVAGYGCRTPRQRPQPERAETSASGQC